MDGSVLSQDGVTVRYAKIYNMVGQEVFGKAALANPDLHNTLYPGARELRITCEHLGVARMEGVVARDSTYTVANLQAWRREGYLSCLRPTFSQMKKGILQRSPIFSPLLFDEDKLQEALYSSFFHSFHKAQCLDHPKTDPVFSPEGLLRWVVRVPFLSSQLSMRRADRPQGMGEVMSIMYLSILNTCIITTKFSMETVRTVMSAIHQDSWMVSLDLKDANLQVPINPDSQRFLHSTWKGIHFQL
ncbi:hypothetical protein E2C01_054590 [Portunus trituberculatus]|uniref:Uncharacterized protein n=1 Tax=Portunus trituberculatus TaxID=210409 RepID=A0A5B7GP31_PORTR|nr:hypothetical protein [Portunus trituberculatus]